MNDTIAAAENFYKEVEGVKLNVPCALWENPNCCLMCFGEIWHKNHIPGEVTKVTLPGGKQKVLQFTFVFAEKKIDKVYQGFVLDYIFKCSDKIPRKYHTYRAQYIVTLAREAEEAFAREKGDTAAEDGDINLSNETESMTDNVGGSGSDIDCENDHAENNIILSRM